MPIQTPAPEYLDEMAWELTDTLMPGQVRGRDLWEGLEILQQVSDYLKETAESLLPADTGVIVGMEGHKVRFESVDAMANFIVVGVMKYGQ